MTSHILCDAVSVTNQQPTILLALPRKYSSSLLMLTRNPFSRSFSTGLVADGKISEAKHFDTLIFFFCSSQYFRFLYIRDKAWPEHTRWI